METKGTGLKRKRLVENIAKKLNFYHNQDRYEMFFDGMCVPKTAIIEFYVFTDRHDYGIQFHWDDHTRFMLYDNYEEGYETNKNDILPNIENRVKIYLKEPIFWMR